MRLSTCYEFGICVVRNESEAQRLLNLAKGSNDPKAQAAVGWRYLSSDPQQADAFFRAAALQGSADGFFGLGCLHMREKEESSDPLIVKAVNLARLHEAARKAFDDAGFTLIATIESN